MPDTPGNPTPEETMAAKMAELDTMKADLQAQKDAATAQASTNDELNRTMAGLTEAINAGNRPAPEPEPELEGEFDEATLRAGAVLAKRQLEAYHAEISPRLARNDAAQFENEWSRAQTADPKNFGRLETTMRKHFDTNPELKQPGAVAALFTQMKGHHYNKLQEMDRADRQKEVDTVDPNKPNYVDESKKTKSVDTLDENEWGLVKGMGREGDGTPNVHPEHYYLSKYGSWPNFPEGYLTERGYKPVERNS